MRIWVNTKDEAHRPNKLAFLASGPCAGTHFREAAGLGTVTILFHVGVCNTAAHVAYEATAVAAKDIGRRSST